MAEGPVRALVTAAAGKIGYALVLLIAEGKMLGPDQPVILHLLENPSAAVSLNQVKIDLEDAAFPLLRGVIATTDLVEAWTGVNIAIMLHGFPGEEGLEKLYAMSKNVSIFKSEASALEKHAAANCKVVVVGDLANTNALILKNFAPSIPEKNITCLTRLDQNRALGQLAKYLNIQVSDAKNLIAWGSSSSSQYLDFDHATVQTLDGDKTVRELLADPPIPWLTERFLSTVVQHAAERMRAGNTVSALPSARAVCDHIRDWVLGTPLGTWVSMGVYSDGSYNVPTGLFYSFPVTCANGEWEIVQGLPIDELSRSKLDLTADELYVERAYCMLMLASLRDA